MLRRSQFYPNKRNCSELSRSHCKVKQIFPKFFQSFFIETMQLYLTIQGRVNFTQLARFGRSCESRFRQNFRKSIDWIAFNRTFLTDDNDRLWAIAIDPSYISKSGKKTPGLSSWTALTTKRRPSAEKCSSPRT